LSAGHLLAKKRVDYRAVTRPSAVVEELGDELGVPNRADARRRQGLQNKKVTVRGVKDFEDVAIGEKRY
jgi:hypothetical protein